MAIHHGEQYNYPHAFYSAALFNRDPKGIRALGICRVRRMTGGERVAGYVALPAGHS